MRVVFMGTPEFSVPSLRALSDSHDVVCVVTQPDRPRGRGREPLPSPVKQVAVDLGLPVAQPEALDAAFVSEISALVPDIICVAAFGRILGEDLLGVPPHGCVNVHASLLPRHRGAAPVHRAILDGDATTGVSIMRMEAGLDTGPVALEREMALGSKDAGELTAELATLGAQALTEVLRSIEDGTAEWNVQPEQGVTYAEKVTSDDVALDPSLSVDETLRRVRASTRSARAKVCVAGTTLDVISAAPIDRSLTPGEFACDKDHLAIGVADGAVSLTRVRPPGKSEMQGCAFARGARLDPDASWACPS